VEIKFKKYSGAGNDFVLIDKSENSNLNLSSDLIVKICDRRNGIGSDGILFIVDDVETDFGLFYYNADGSLGSLCGNGSRCAIKYAYLSKKFKGSSTNFVCGNRHYKGEVFENGEVKFYLQNPTDLKMDLEIEAFNQKFDACFINTGSPHVVIKAENIIKKDEDGSTKKYNISNLPVYKLGKELRYHKLFEPKGTNVNFIQIIDCKVHIRTYERGVEDETLACGTGSVASALICSITDGLKSPISLITKGNDELKVEFEKNDDLFFNIALIGPAKEIFSGIIYL